MTAGQIYEVVSGTIFVGTALLLFWLCLAMARGKKVFSKDGSDGEWFIKNPWWMVAAGLFFLIKGARQLIDAL